MGKVEKIPELDDWDEKQDAIDDLFEQIHDDIRYKEKEIGDDEDHHEYMTTVLGSQPNFAKLVERELEKYLKVVVKNEKNGSSSNESESETSNSAEESEG